MPLMLGTMEWNEKNHLIWVQCYESELLLEFPKLLVLLFGFVLAFNLMKKFTVPMIFYISI